MRFPREIALGSVRSRLLLRMVEYVPHAILQLTGSHTDATTESCTYMPKTSAVDFGPQFPRLVRART